MVKVNLFSSSPPHPAACQQNHDQCNFWFLFYQWWKAFNLFSYLFPHFNSKKCCFSEIRGIISEGIILSMVVCKVNILKWFVEAGKILTNEIPKLSLIFMSLRVALNPFVPCGNKHLNSGLSVEICYYVKQCWTMLLQSEADNKETASKAKQKLCSHWAVHTFLRNFFYKNTFLRIFFAL